MNIPYTFFEDEVRDGFYVSGIVKRSWAAQLEVLERIDAVCKKHNIKWFADCGTLLGAVRHGGFVPWDDDLDICMLRDDYNRFIKVAQDELPQGYVLLNIETEEGYYELLSRVTNGRRINVDDEFLEEYHGFPYVAGIDIFPLDFVAPNEDDENLRKEICKIVMGLAADINEENENLPEALEYLSQIEIMCGVKFDRSKPMKKQLHQLLVNLFSLYSRQEASEVVLMPYWLKDNSHKYKLSYFENQIMIPFETTTIAAPAAYDAVLRIEYGDYMRIVRSGGVHDYPYFREHEEKLIECGGTAPHIFRFDQKQLFEGCARSSGERAILPTKPGKKEVVFMPYKASTWDAMENVWREAKKDPDCDVYVIPMLYCDKKLDGQANELRCDIDKFPDYVDATKYDAYDFERRHPDVIIIQNPYDSKNYTTSVHPLFYSNNLKKFTDKLVYIPYFVLEDFGVEDRAWYTMRYFASMPGVVNADMVVLPSEQMKKNYIDFLIEWAVMNEELLNDSEGENVSGNKEGLGELLAEALDRKFVVFDRSLWESNGDKDLSTFDIPTEWIGRLKDSDGNVKKIILYGTTLSTIIQHGYKSVDKMKNVFDTFKNQSDVVVIWKPDVLVNDALAYSNPELLKAYLNAYEQYIDLNVGLLSENVDLETLVKLSDAYYGDASRVANRFRSVGKPVMIENVEI